MNEISIILIEDHDLTRMGLRAALQSHSALKVIGEAANATQGLKLLETAKPDVAVVDIGLPDMDGIELTRKFRRYQAETGQTATKILILTKGRRPIVENCAQYPQHPRQNRHRTRHCRKASMENRFFISPN